MNSIAPDRTAERVMMTAVAMNEMSLCSLVWLPSTGAGIALAGGGTLITFPALVALSVPPVAANIRILSAHSGLPRRNLRAG